MRNRITIVSDHCTLHLPTGGDYDREVLRDHLRDVVQRHGSARLIDADGSVSVTRARRAARDRCTACGAAAGAVVGRRGDDVFCLHCASDRDQRHPLS